MTDYTDAIILSVIGISILAVPAASEKVAISEQEDEGIVKTVESNLGDKFRFETSESQHDIEISGSESRIKTTSTPENDVIRVENPEGTMKSYKSANKSYKKVNTPYGILKTGYKNGERFSNFEGRNRTKVENIKRQLDDIRQEKESTIERRKQAIIENQTADIKIRESHKASTINLTNQDDEEVDLSSWQINSRKSSDAYEGAFTFDNTTLQPDETVKIAVGGQEYEKANYSTSEIRLYDRGDHITLKDEWGNKVTTYSYD